MGIEVQGLCFRYPGGWGLGPLDLELPSGCVTALVGPNGAGKTTLMRTLAGLLVPDSGTIALNGCRVADRWSLARRVVFTASEPAFPRGSRVDDLATLRAHLRGFREEARKALLERLSERLGRPLDVDPHTLSRGQRLTLTLELAFAGLPRFVLLDEPWAGLDPLAVDRLFAQMRRLAEEGVAVLISSHDLFALPSVADRFLFLVGGCIRAAGTLEELRGDGPCPGLGGPDVLRDLYRRLVAEERDA